MLGPVLLRAPTRRGLLVLAYHSVNPSWSDPLSVTPEVFRGQLEALAEKGYRGVTFTQAGLGVAPGRRIAITFDDAFSSAARWGAAILDELGWPATVFVATDAVSAHEPMRWLLEDRWRPESDDALLPMTWDELRDLADAGWEVGSHSRTHTRLSTLGGRALDEELGGSRREILSRLGSCESISYPWGEVDARVIAAARRAGYRAGSGLAGRFRYHDPMAVPRFAISSADGSLWYGLKTSPGAWMLRSSPAWDCIAAIRALRP